jgi:hypothetical protein
MVNKGTKIGNYKVKRNSVMEIPAFAGMTEGKGELQIPLNRGLGTWD